MASTQEFKTALVLPGDPTSALHAATKQYVDNAASSTMPAGSVTAFAGSSAPTGWLLCAGQAVSRTTYAALFAVIGTTYGSGNGSTTFNLPDLRGRVPVGMDNMGGTDAGRLDYTNTLGGVGGEQYHTLTVQELPAHSHTMNNAQFNTAAPFFAAGGNYGQNVQGTTSSVGSGWAHNNMQPNILLNYIIKQ